MGIIHVLDKHTAELIAAGEVVERPASVIKELFENSVDAEATMITVSIEHGGVTNLSITDNGCGIHRDDIQTAFLRHATSKVRTEEDLNAISTLGFRGEALASIAAVAHVELVTCAADEEVGTHYVIEGGEEVVLEDVGTAKGTTFTVSNLFYNVPARMKFLKTDIGEGNAVSSVMEKLAISHPEIAVCFIRDGKEIFSTSGSGDLKSCIYTVFGKSFSESLMPVEYSLNGISITGFINKVESGRANRSMQFFFINGRFVKTRTGSAAIEQAFKGSLMVGKFPTCVLFIDMSTSMVDVNVHPSKIEVRFVNEKPVFDVVYHGCKSSIEANYQRKEVSFDKKPFDNKPTSEQLFMSFKEYEIDSKKPVSNPTDYSSNQAPTITGVGISLEKSDIYNVTNKNTNSVSIDVPFEESYMPKEAVNHTLTTENPVESSIHYIGEIFSTYILAEMNGSLYLIDKHAAHERILYNKYKMQEHTESQQLLEPISVSLTSDEYTAIVNHIDMLETAGFYVEDFGAREILVRSVPILLSDENIVEIIQEIAGHFIDGKDDVIVDHLDWLYHNTACRAAIKAGNHNQREDLELLANTVLQDDTLRTCPHGRPICVCMSKKEIEKQFGRIV